LNKNNTTLLFQPLHFLCFPIEDKLKVCHIDTIQFIEAESQAVLNALTEQDFQDALKMAEALETVHTRGRGLLGG
jgi:hypothetical protein